MPAPLAIGTKAMGWAENLEEIQYIQSSKVGSLKPRAFAPQLGQKRS